MKGVFSIMVIADITLERKMPSYLLGTLVGATGAAAAMRACLAFSPYLFETVVKPSISSLLQVNATRAVCLLTGATIGATAGLIRTEFDRRYGHFQERIDSSLLFGIAHLVIFSAVGGAPGAVLVPYAVAGDLAAKVVNATQTRQVRQRYLLG